MRKISKDALGSVASLVAGMLMAGVAGPTVHAAEWRVTVGA
jgi:hypothetical protein